MSTPWSRQSGRIAAAFGRARRYEEAARPQAQVAAELARRIATARPMAAPRVLEIGCGTGFLTRALGEQLDGARWVVTDIAPEMVERARQVGPVSADYRVVDGEAVDPALGQFDLIVSSLAFQWFADLPAAVERLAAHLAPGGLLAFTTMAAGSFAEWTGVLSAEGLPSGTPAYPDHGALAKLSPRDLECSAEVVGFPQAYADARSFLGQLKAIGAATPAEGYRPLSPLALRRAMARFDAGPRIVTYQVGFCLLSRCCGEP